MPWWETAPMDERIAFIADHRHGLYSVTELCARAGIRGYPPHSSIASTSAAGRSSRERSSGCWYCRRTSIAQNSS